MKHKPVIGLEVHIELSTKSKMFCNCSAKYFGEQPNSHTCPVCLGLPGALPVPNEKAIEHCRKIGLALNCGLNEFSKFDRKNYFYPDLPKGYQISQYDFPFCVNGYIEIGKENKKIRIKRVHMEEDTGKLMHEDKKTLIDFNRSGVPLVEIVSEPDFENGSEVVEYLKAVQQIVRYLDVSDANMEKGEMRLEPNISLKEEFAEKLPEYKVEVKNINSFRFVEKAINYEIKRQEELLKLGETPMQETRGWNEIKQKTFSQRSKEEAHDYRYFPEPDIPPLSIIKKDIQKLKNSLPELPKEKLLRFINEYSITYYNAEILTRDISLANFYEKTVLEAKKINILPKKIANLIINKKINIQKTTISTLLSEINCANQTDNISKEEILDAIEKTLEKNKSALEDYKKGKTQVIGFLIGQVGKTLEKKVNASNIKMLLEEKLKNE